MPAPPTMLLLLNAREGGARRPRSSSERELEAPSTRVTRSDMAECKRREKVEERWSDVSARAWGVRWLEECEGKGSEEKGDRQQSSSQPFPRCQSILHFTMPTRTYDDNNQQDNNTQ